MKAEVISSTELKLWRLRQTSATAAHFSITVARAEGDWCFTISNATRELVCKKEEQGYKYIATQFNPGGGVLAIMAYTGMLRPKGFRYVKG